MYISIIYSFINFGRHRISWYLPTRRDADARNPRTVHVLEESCTNVLSLHRLPPANIKIYITIFVSPFFFLLLKLEKFIILFFSHFEYECFFWWKLLDFKIIFEVRLAAYYTLVQIKRLLIITNNKRISIAKNFYHFLFVHYSLL